MQIARRSRKPSSQSKSKSQERERQAQSDSQNPDSPAVQDTATSPASEPIPSIQDILEEQAIGVFQYQQRQLQRGQSNQSRWQSATQRLPGKTSSPALPGESLFLPISMSNLLPAEHAASLSQLNVATSPTTMTPTGTPDLGAGALPPDTFFNSVLQFWRLKYMSNFWPAHVYLNPSHQAVQFTDNWIRSMVINNPAMLHGLFSGALSYITNYLPPTENTPMLWARAIHHYGKCLEETRNQLARPGISTEESMSLIHGMTTFSFHCQDLESCQVHRTASMRLLQSHKGGIESVHPVLKYLLILCDSLISGHVPKRPSIDVDSWAPKPWAEETCLRPFDDMFSFDTESSLETDMAVFLLDSIGHENDDAEDLLELINWHREALVANDVAFTLASTSPSASPKITAPIVEGGRDRSDPIYTWLSLRQYALSCLCSDMFVDFVETKDPEPSILPQLHRVFHSCILLATSYLFQFVMRRDMDAPCMAYIPYQHLRTQLELLMTLMNQHRRTQTPPAWQGRVGRGPVNPIPTDSLLFLFFAGAVIEECDGPRRVRGPHHISRAGVIASPAVEHPGDLIDERWFSVHFAMVLQKLNIDVWENAKRVLKRFVYAERVLDRFLQVLVSKKLEFLAALVAGVPVKVAAGGTGFFGGPGGPSPVRQGVSSSSRPLSPSRRTSLQMPTHYGARLQQADMPMHIPLAGPPSTIAPEQIFDALPLFGPTPVSLSATVPNAAADWWQDMGYGMGGEEDFSMDLDMDLSMGAGLDTLPDLQGEDLSDQEETNEE